MPKDSRSRQARIGILDHTGSSLGGGQLVAAHLAATLSRQFEVEMIHFDTEPLLEKLAAAFGLDLRDVRERRWERSIESFNIPGRGGIVRQLLENARALSQPYDLFIYSGHGVPPFCYARRGIVYSHFPMEASPDEGLKADPRWLRRNTLDRWIRGNVYRQLWRMRMKGYDRILANSSFTAEWIKRLWGERGEVVYPPVELSLPKVKKQKLIVSIGRFTGGRRSKNQLAQVWAFRQFLTEVRGDWRMVLIGSYKESAEDRAYLNAVQRTAEGLPVTLLVNADRQAICRALAEAQLFWHTTGLAINVAEHPEQAEHFGIVTLEAMRAGCIPVVIASGGQLEIVENGVSGFLTEDLLDLVRRSIAVTREENQMSTVSEQARQRSMAFTREAFDQRVAMIVRQCLEERRGSSSVRSAGHFFSTQ